MSMHTALNLIFAPVLGVLAGVVISLLAQLFDVAGWAFSVIAIAAIGLFLWVSAWIETAGNTLIVRGMAHLSKASGDIQTRLDAELADQDRARHGPARTVFFASMGVGIIASLIWTPFAIMAWINSIPLLNL